ncbi:hypothetical protein [Phaeobacter sp. 11ANDIMAR09]|uniref:hypothetical protein n=1 Tax=Phaeobacter sp. 11ANDIMAR09 TaxID=1225647 RepID=UPI0006C8965A|nr:hypothetical protein [Phaeobacter sp. 11ANDIMAR09]KPD12952.1 hypothetical protein AN476_08510 [Phaeobacter sp. 11ANDIMAR09]
MSNFNPRGSELKALLKLARKQPVAFAYNPGKNAKEDYFGLHRQKSPEIIMKQARSEGPGNKVAFGTFTVDGKDLSLTCLKTLPALAKKLRAYLKAEKISLSIRVLDADGTELEADLDEAETQAKPASQETSAAAPVDDQETEAPNDPSSHPAPTDDEGAAPTIVAQEASLKQRLASLTADAKQTGLAKTLLPRAAKSLVQFMKAQDFAKAEALLGALEQKLADQGATLVTEWEKAHNRLALQVEQAKQASPQAADKLDKAWADICKQAEEKRFDAALKMAAKLAPLLQKQIDRAQSAERDKQPAKESRLPKLAALERRVDSLLAALA